MNKIITSACMIITTTAYASITTAQTINLSVETKISKGTVYAAVFTSQAAFDEEKSTAVTRVAAKEGFTELKLLNIKKSIYGISVYQDLNGNNQLDYSLFGAPNEPYGFSNNPTIGFSAPDFNEFKFEFDGISKSISITLNGG